MSLIYLFSPLFDGIKKVWRDNQIIIGNDNSKGKIIAELDEGVAWIYVGSNDIRIKFDNFCELKDEIELFSSNCRSIYFKKEYFLGLLR